MKATTNNSDKPNVVQLTDPHKNQAGDTCLDPALRKWIQGDQKLKVILGCVVSLRPGWDIRNKNKTIKQIFC